MFTEDDKKQSANLVKLLQVGRWTLDGGQILSAANAMLWFGNLRGLMNEPQGDPVPVSVGTMTPAEPGKIKFGKPRKITGK